MSDSFFDKILKIFTGDDTDTDTSAVASEQAAGELLSKNNIILAQKSVSREEAVRAAGNLLVKNGYVTKAYVEGMLKREEEMSTYIGKGLAIPHSETDIEHSVKRSGIVVLQYPGGIKWEDNSEVYLVIGIASKDDDHLTILANIAETMDDYSDEQMQELYDTLDKDVIYKVFVR